MRMLALCLLVMACRSGTPAGPEPVEKASVKIENRSSLNMDMHVRRNDGRTSPLGLAPAGETVTFALSEAVTTGAAWVRFEAWPAHSSGDPEVSEPFQMRAGEQFTWSIPPQ
jgi:hypothetical protein